MLRLGILTAVILTLTAGGGLAQSVALSGAQSAAPPYEIVKRDTDLEADASGQYWQSDETVYRPFTSLGVEALQKISLSYTSGYQSLTVIAYTLKKDGRKIDVPEDKILQGHGETTKPGFADTRTMMVVFPDLQIGDQAVLITRTQQLVPWFADVFAMTESFPRSVRVTEARFALTTRGNDSLFRIHAEGLEAASPITLGGKTRRVWRYRNDQPLRSEAGIVTEFSGSPHISVTTLQGYDKMAAIYAEIFKPKSAVTPEIAALADKLTKGVSDRRAQAKILYEWVSSQIQYVNIVLGAGGFVPHEAAAVLKNRYGDCKDHVMLLEALLAARKIDSSAVLIRAGENQFELPVHASPFLFDHLIAYIPEFDMYLDSTSRYAPFGILPSMNAGKSVVIVKTGKVAKTPAVTAASSSLGSDTVITIKEDGSADGVTKVRATGAASVDMRASMAMLPQDSEPQVSVPIWGRGLTASFSAAISMSWTVPTVFPPNTAMAIWQRCPGPVRCRPVSLSNPFLSPA